MTLLIVTHIYLTTHNTFLCGLKSSAIPRVLVLVLHRVQLLISHLEKNLSLYFSIFNFFLFSSNETIFFFFFFNFQSQTSLSLFISKSHVQQSQKSHMRKMRYTHLYRHLVNKIIFSRWVLVKSYYLLLKKKFWSWIPIFIKS